MSRMGENTKLASCPGCNGTGDQGGNPSYGVCDDCGGTGKVLQPERGVIEVPDIKFVIADYLELRDEAMGFVSTDEERCKSAIELHDAIQRIHAKLAPALDRDAVIEECAKVADAVGENCRKAIPGGWISSIGGSTSEGIASSIRHLKAMGE